MYCKPNGHIIAVPRRLCEKGQMSSVMKCCVILHNMVVEELDTLVELETSKEIGESPVGSDVECCFKWKSRNGMMTYVWGEQVLTPVLKMEFTVLSVQSTNTENR